MAKAKEIWSNEPFPEEMTVKTDKGYPIKIKKSNFRGGEGIIYITERGDKYGNLLAVKIFNNEKKAKEKEEKISAIIDRCLELKNKNPNLFEKIKNHIAIPRVKIYSEDGEFIGFAMTYIDSSNSTTLYKFINDEKYKFYSTNIAYQAKNKVAYNFVKTIRLAHKAGFIIGDLHTDNVLITKRTEIILLDVDNYGFIHKGNIYNPNAIREDVLPPEYIEKNTKYSISQESDIYLTAVHVYSIFMMGFTPFNFVRTEDLGDENDIKLSGKNVFNTGSPPPYLPPLEILGKKTLQVLPKCLDADPYKRPKLKNLQEALRENFKNMKVCSNGHVVLPVKNKCFICDSTKFSEVMESIHRKENKKFPIKILKNLFSKAIKFTIVSS